jgi:hypothetical protein
MTGGFPVSPNGGTDRPSAAQERLLQHLHALREDAPEPAARLPAVVMRTARWQVEVRPFAQAAGRLIAGIGDSARVMVGRTRA